MVCVLFLWKSKVSEDYDPSDVCGYFSASYPPRNIQTVGDKTAIAKLLSYFLNRILSDAFQSLRKDYNLIYPGINKDFGAGSVSVNSLSNLIDGLKVYDPLNVQSFPAPQDVSAGDGMNQTVYVVCPIHSNVVLNLSISLKYPVPVLLSSDIVIDLCSSIFVRLYTTCSDNSTVVKRIEIDRRSLVDKIFVDIKNQDLKNLVDIGQYFTNKNLEDILKGVLNDKIQDIFPLLENYISGYLPYKVPLPQCVLVPPNVLKNSRGVEYSGIYGYRPVTYKTPSNDDTKWMQCTLTCAQSGIGQYQQCLDACVDYVDSSKVDTAQLCSERDVNGFFEFVDRSGQPGVEPNGPLWSRVCRTAVPLDSTLIPDLSAGYQTWKSVDVLVPPIDGVAPGLKGVVGARSSVLGNVMSHGGIPDCRGWCITDPKCLGFDYVETSDSTRSYGEGTCYKIVDGKSPLVVDSNFVSYRNL